MSDVGIRIEGLYKVFGPKPPAVMARVREGADKQQLLEETGHVIGLRAIDMDVAPGSIHVVMGLSGSGKSTILRHVNRLIDPTEGRVLVGSAEVTAMDHKALMEFRRHAVSMVFQRFALFPHRTVFDNVGYGLNIQGIDKDQRRRRTEAWIERVGLTGYEDHYPAQLSGGMQQRVGLARALATDADVLLMDEAFSALDPLIRAEMQDVLLTLQAELNKTILFVSHDLDEALKLGDRITILKDGEIAQEDGPQSIIMRPADDYVADFVKHINRGRVVTVASIMTGYKGVSTGMELPAETVLEDASVALAKAGLSQATVTGRNGAPLGHVTLPRIVEASQRPG